MDGRGTPLRVQVALGWLAFVGFLALTAPLLPLPGPLDLDLSSVASPPSSGHLIGTDELGRDVLARLVSAAGATLLIVSGATVVSMLIALILGSAAGLIGGWMDSAVKLAVDLLWTVPFVVFVVLIISVVGISPLSLILSIGVINWVGAARVLRGEVAKLRDADFIVAARARGGAPLAILIADILPSLRNSVAILAAYTAVEVLTLETGLAFVGLSLPAPRPTWGGMLADGLTYFSTAWWLVASVSIAITATLAALQTLARSLERAT
jgi:peptide/nickel transport system permease protein